MDTSNDKFYLFSLSVCCSVVSKQNKCFLRKTEVRSVCALSKTDCETELSGGGTPETKCGGGGKGRVGYVNHFLGLGIVITQHSGDVRRC